MLDSVKIARRQSEIRQALAEPRREGHARPRTKPAPWRRWTREYRTNETRFRAALVAEDSERRDAGGELETRDGRELAELDRRLRAAAGGAGARRGPRRSTARPPRWWPSCARAGGYRGIPVPWAALERRAGETDRLGHARPDPDAADHRPAVPRHRRGRMGAQMIAIDSGAVEWPVVTSSVTAGWARRRAGNVAGPTAFATTDAALTPEQNLGIQMKHHPEVAEAVRRRAGTRRAPRHERRRCGGRSTQAMFIGTGANGQPLGVIAGQATYGYGTTAVSADAELPRPSASAVVRFMAANAAERRRARCGS